MGKAVWNLLIEAAGRVSGHPDDTAAAFGGQRTLPPYILHYVRDRIIWSDNDTLLNCP